MTLNKSDNALRQLAESLNPEEIAEAKRVAQAIIACEEECLDSGIAGAKRFLTHIESMVANDKA